MLLSPGLLSSPVHYQSVFPVEVLHAETLFFLKRPDKGGEALLL